jgi:site-specific recombinase XerD
MSVMKNKDLVKLNNNISKTESKNLSKIEKKNYYNDHDIKYLKKDELIKLFTYLKKTNQFYFLLCLFLYETASRFSEATSVKFNDLNENDNSLRLKNLKQKNQNDFRIIVISNELKYLILNQYIKLKEQDINFTKNNYVFIKKPGKLPIKRQSVDFKLKQFFKEALGDEYMDRAHAHTFRHSKAISLLESSGNIMQVKLLLGHKSLANTIIYLKYSNPDLFRALEQDNEDFYNKFNL